MSSPDRIRALAELLEYTRNSVRQIILVTMKNYLIHLEEEIPEEITDTLGKLILREQGVSHDELTQLIEDNQTSLSRETYLFLVSMMNCYRFEDIY